MSDQTYTDASDLLLDVAICLALDDYERRFPRATEQEANCWAARHVREFFPAAIEWAAKEVAARRRIN